MSDYPQSGSPVSDRVIDTLKQFQSPPSRAQVEKKEYPQSGTPGSDMIIDGLKKISGKGDENTGKAFSQKPESLTQKKEYP